MGAAAQEAVAQGAVWGPDDLSTYNLTTFPAIVCYPAPAVRARVVANKPSTEAGSSPQWMLIDHSGGGGGGVDYASIADGLQRCAARGARWQNYVEEYNKLAGRFAKPDNEF